MNIDFCKIKVSCILRLTRLMDFKFKMPHIKTSIMTRLTQEPKTSEHVQFMDSLKATNPCDFNHTSKFALHSNPNLLGKHQCQIQWGEVASVSPVLEYLCSYATTDIDYDCLASELLKHLATIKPPITLDHILYNKPLDFCQKCLVPPYMHSSSTSVYQSAHPERNQGALDYQKSHHCNHSYCLNQNQNKHWSFGCRHNHHAYLQKRCGLSDSPVPSKHQTESFQNSSKSPHYQHRCHGHYVKTKPGYFSSHYHQAIRSSDASSKGDGSSLKLNAPNHHQNANQVFSNPPQSTFATNSSDCCIHRQTNNIEKTSVQNKEPSKCQQLSNIPQMPPFSLHALLLAPSPLCRNGNQRSDFPNRNCHSVPVRTQVNSSCPSSSSQETNARRLSLPERA